MTQKQKPKQNYPSQALPLMNVRLPERLLADLDAEVDRQQRSRAQVARVAFAWYLSMSEAERDRAVQHYAAQPYRKQQG
jgi:metal-responsive CopG/Arc/MetJ family transcriptional regulator